MNEPVRRLPLPHTDRARGFAEALQQAKGKHLLIALRGHPDPDGIASALAQAHIAQRQGVGKTTIGYCHELSHRENRALVKLLNVDMKKMRNVNDIDMRPPLNGMRLATAADFTSGSALTRDKSSSVSIHLIDGSR